jgi:periplasmic divalent cation tolerance protein
MKSLMKRKKLSSVVLIYCTAKNQKEALAIGEGLMEQKLAACINVFPSMISSYYWKNRKVRSREAVLIVKTVKNQKQAVLREIKKVHSYSVPCVLFLETSGGNKEFIHWINSEISSFE